ncbi:MAG: hypothetical protein V4568_04085 [Pseudomonadota bacterium]
MSPWFGFEWVAGHLHSIIWRSSDWLYPDLDGFSRNVYALKLALNFIVLLAFGLFGLIFVPVFQQLFQHRPMPHIMAGLAITAVLFGGVIGRLMLARPEAFMMLAMFSAWRLPPWRWVMLMMLLQPMYWLAFIYSAGVLLIAPWRWSQKLLAAGLIVSVYALFWHYYCGLDAVANFFQLTSAALKTRLIHATENRSLLEAAVSLKVIWITLAALVLHRWGQGDLSARERWSIMTFMVLWIMTNQVRYVVYCVPCLIYMWARQCFSADERQENIDTGSCYLFAALLTALASFLPILPINGFQAPLFKTLPPDAKVLTFFDPSTFILPALYPDVKVSPSMEVGFTELSLQRFLKEHKRDQGKETEKFNCAALTKNFTAFTYVVDSAEDRRVPVSVPECLRLEETHGVWRLWRVVAVAPADRKGE